MANQSSKIDKSISFASLSVAPTNPMVNEIYNDSVLGLLKWSGLSWGPLQVTNWVPYLPIFQGIGIVSDVGFFWKRVGDSIEIQGTVFTGSTSAVTASVTLPPGLVLADPSKIPFKRIVGTFVTNNIGSYGAGVMLATNSLDYFTFGIRDVSNSPLTDQTGLNAISGTATLSLFLTAPIQGWGI